MQRTWNDVLGVLPEEAKPRWGSFPLVYTDAPTPSFVWRAAVDKACFTFDAHAHIAIAAQSYVREWCRGREYNLLIGEANSGIGIYAHRKEYGQFRLGSGPDDPSAWYAAVVYVNDEAKR